MSGANNYNYEYFNISFPYEYVAVIEISRPKKLNAFIEVMWLNLSQIFKRLSHDSDVRAIVLTAEGDRAFTAGLDVQAASTGGTLMGNEGQDGARVANKIRRHILEFQECITSIEKCEKPVIAALHGISYGLALDMTLACDIRLCAQDTRFSVKEVDIGLAADIGTLTRLPKANVAMSFIKDVCLTARDFSAQEALTVGIVSGVYPTKAKTMEQALNTAKLIASKSPVAVMVTKEALNFARDHSVEDGLKHISIWNAAYLQTQDVKDAMTAGLQKRKPKFSKL